MNFHLKECMHWNSLLVKANCYKRDRALTSFTLFYAYLSFAAHAHGCHIWVAHS